MKIKTCNFEEPLLLLILDKRKLTVSFAVLADKAASLRRTLFGLIIFCGLGLDGLEPGEARDGPEKGGSERGRGGFEEERRGGGGRREARGGRHLGAASERASKRERGEERWTAKREVEANPL